MTNSEAKERLEIIYANLLEDHDDGDETETERETIEAVRVAIEALQEPQALTLGQLKTMDGKPIWTKTMGIINSGRWELIEFEDFGNNLIKCTTLYEKYDMTTSEFENTYGKTWLAYTAEPNN